MDSVSSISLSTPLAGLQQAQARMGDAASVISDPGNASSVVTLSSAAVAMNGASVALAANIKAMKAESEVLGTLINIMG